MGARKRGLDLVLEQPPEPPPELRKFKLGSIKKIFGFDGGIPAESLSALDRGFNKKIEKFSRDKSNLQKEVSELKDKKRILSKYILNYEKLRKKKNDLIQRELKITQREKSVYKTQAELAERRKLLAIDRKGVERKINLLAKKQNQLVQQAKDSEAKSKLFKDDEQALYKKEEELLKSIKLLEADNASLADKETEIITTSNEIKENKKVLKNEEKKVLGKLKELQKTKQDISEGMAALIESKKEIEIGSVQRQRQLEKLEKQWIGKEQSLNNNHALLRGLKSIFINRSKMIENGVKTLESEEKGIVNNLNLLEKNKQLLVDKEQEIIAKINQLGETKTFILNKEKELRKREEAVNKAKEYETKLPEIVQSISKLKKEQGIEIKKLEKLTKEGTAKLGFLKDKEIGLREKETFLNQKEQELKQKELGLSKQEGFTSEESFHSYLREEKRLPPVNFGALNRKRDLAAHPEVNPLIAKARELIKTRDTAGAMKIISQIESLHKHLGTEDEEKRKISYDIMELKTDVKLAALGS